MSAETRSLLSSWRGRRVLIVLCTVAFMDFVDASITNVALPHIRAALGFSQQTLQWVPSGYLLTYGGLMLLGGRLADLFGRRRVMLTGTALVGVASLAGGLAQSSEVFVGARLLQGAGAAMMLPAALSLLTTTFTNNVDRNRALGAWAGVAGLSSAVGILLGGVLVQGPGWRWVMFVNPIWCVLIAPAVLNTFKDDRPSAAKRNFDLLGSLLGTAGMLLLVFALVKAPNQGWGATATVLELTGASALLIAFLLVERVRSNPLIPHGTLGRAVVAANLTGLLGFAGMLSLFFFLTLYMQTVLGYSPLAAGAAYLPLTFAVGLFAGVGAKLVIKFGSRPVTAVGALIAAGALALLHHAPVHGHYVTTILPGTLLFAAGMGPVFVGVTGAANAGATADRAGIVAALMNAAQQVGGALGLAVLSALATSRADHLIATGHEMNAAATAGYDRALLAAAAFLVLAALVALATTNTRENPMEATHLGTVDLETGSIEHATAAEPA